MTKSEEQNTSVDASNTLLTPGYYTIDQVAKQTNLTKRTLRYYEEVGLLPPAERTEGNYRRYTEADVRYLERIKELRDLLGFSLNDIRALLEVEDERAQLRNAFRQETDLASKVAQLERADELLQTQLHLIEQKIAGLQSMRADLQARLEQHARKKAVLRDQEQHKNS